MRNLFRIVSLALVVPAVALADGSGNAVPGAKDLFYEPSQGTLGVQLPSQPQQKVNPPKAHGQPGSSQKKSPPSGVAGPVNHRKVSPGPGPAQPAVNRNRGLHYWIELRQPDGGSSYVTDQHIFRLGDQIRLHFVSNTEGRIMLLQTGTSGSSTILFPAPSQELTDNLLKPGESRILPSDSHWFTFRGKAGTERIIAVFARDVAELNRLSIKPQMGPEETRDLMHTAERIRGSKDLIIETETTNASEVGTYGINLKGEAVILEILLQHR